MLDHNFRSFPCLNVIPSGVPPTHLNRPGGLASVCLHACVFVACLLSGFDFSGRVFDQFAPRAQRSFFRVFDSFLRAVFDYNPLWMKPRCTQ